MSVKSIRTITFEFENDLVGHIPPLGAVNPTAPAEFVNQALTSGNNSISVPSGAVGLTIVPPHGSVVALILKGVNGDTGIHLHDTHPTSLGLNSATTSLVINAASSVTVQLIWS